MRCSKVVARAFADSDLLSHGHDAARAAPPHQMIVAASAASPYLAIRTNTTPLCSLTIV
jgi:hypothetical protein